MIVLIREGETVEEWIKRVRSMPLPPGYPATPASWIEIMDSIRTEQLPPEDGTGGED